MKSRLIILLALTALTVAAIAGCTGSAEKAEAGKQTNADAAETGGQHMHAAVGQMAPDFTLVDAHGKTHSLSEYKGKFVVLEWVNFGCPFVRKHYDSNNMQTLQANYTGQDVVWLSICSSAPGKQGYFTGQELLDRIKSEKSNASAYLVDADGTVGRLYGAKTTPDMFIIDPAGMLVYAGAIDDKPSTDQADINGANNYVRLALDAARGGQPIVTASTTSYGCSVKY